jgi:hypothetical protein
MLKKGSVHFKVQKTPEHIRAIQSHEKSPFVICDAVSPKKLQEIEAVFASCKTIDTQRHEKLFTKQGPRGVTVHPDEAHKSRLEETLRPVLDGYLQEPYEIDFAFHQNKFPYGIHTDSGYDPKELIYKQGIIPLEIKPSLAKVYTVIFAEKVYHSTGFPLRDAKDLYEAPQDSLDRAIDPSMLPAEASKLQVAEAFEWKIGSMTIWDRAHLHCSSLFKATGIESKTGLMWITRRKS